MNENEKIKEYLESGKVPEQLSPENIRKLLDGQVTEMRETEESPGQKRKRISAGGRAAAIAAACALVAGGAAVIGRSALPGRHTVQPQEAAVESSDAESGQADEGTAGESKDESSEESVNVKADAFMSGASTYDDIYELFRRSSESSYAFTKDSAYTTGAVTNGAETGADVMESAAEDEEAFFDADDGTMLAGGGGMGGGDESGYSDTYNQEDGVLEADIVKTDGRNIYSIYTYYNYDEYKGYSFPTLNIASVDNGAFTGTSSVDISADVDIGQKEGFRTNVSVDDMYLYNDMIAVIGSMYTSVDYDYWAPDTVWDMYWDNDTRTFVAFYTAGSDPQFLGAYYQDGWYGDVRIAPDGYMYLVTSYSSCSFDQVEEAENIERYIPACGTDGDFSCIAPGDILLPDEDIDGGYYLSYSVIGSIDLTSSGKFREADTKALAGYSGTLYSSADNLYAASGWDETEITRIAIGGGSIEPAASGTVKGFVRDQFSMSEYGGYFRIAATTEDWYRGGNFFTDLIGLDVEEEYRTNNYLYVLDMDMNVVGSISDFGLDETIKSVNFQGDTAYVVTYEQTDPLFAIDLSDPAAPIITDEFKILGYSTYMQKWDDGLLFGFGADADEEGIEHGVKAVMFDNSDPADLQEVGYYAVTAGEDEWVYSDAAWERKALLIAPEKNLIGFPVLRSSYSYDDDYFYSTEISSYVFLSYEEGQFAYKGELGGEIIDYNNSMVFNRALYIGDYVYTVSGSRCVAADIDTLTQTDETYFGLG